ncbi:hypothetical protein Tco_0803287 [Tanacetum coccineum]|uniref:Reverse transcriptase domain-containing protein n=1 Tax=Tanacetum coccineum TaxID=301880 RepID=A0ABQ5A156_9ASTR
MSNSAERAQTPANSAVRNTAGKGSKQATDGNLRKRKTKKRRSPSLDTMSRSTRPGQSQSVFSRLRQGKSSSTRQRSPVSTTVFTKLGAKDRNVFTRLREKNRYIYSRLGPKVSSRHKHTNDKRHASSGMSAEDPNRGRKEARKLIRSYVTCFSKRHREVKEEWDTADRTNRRRPTRTENVYLSESEHDEGGRWKSKSKKQRSSDEDDRSQPWLCEETDPFTKRIRYFEVPKRTRMPTNVKTYDGTGDPEDHIKIFQAAAKIER